MEKVTKVIKDVNLSSVQHLITTKPYVAAQSTNMPHHNSMRGLSIIKKNPWLILEMHRSTFFSSDPIWISADTDTDTRTLFVDDDDCQYSSYYQWWYDV